MTDLGPIKEITHAQKFMAVVDAIHKARCEIDNTEHRTLEPAYQAFSLNVKTSETPVDRTPFHFDGSFVSSVYAIRLPENRSEGNLMVYPNLRTKIKPLHLAQIVARLLRHFSLLHEIVRPKEIEYCEGGLHVFFGDATLHGVKDVSRGERITITFNSNWHQNPPRFQTKKTEAAA